MHHLTGDDRLHVLFKCSYLVWSVKSMTPTFHGLVSYSSCSSLVQGYVEGNFMTLNVKGDTHGISCEKKKIANENFLELELERWQVDETILRAQLMESYIEKRGVTLPSGFVQPKVFLVNPACR